MSAPQGPSSSRAAWLVLAMIAMIALPAALTLHTVRVAPLVPMIPNDVSPHGYTVSLLLFILPSLAIAGWFLPREGVHVSKHAFWWTIALLFPLGALLDFFFAQFFFTYPNHNAVLGISAPALGHPVPIEEYIFYFTGFLVVLLFYIWLDEYWLSAYNVPLTAAARTDFNRLFRFHPLSLVMAAGLIVAGIVYRKYFSFAPPGFPGYFIFLVAGALGPSAMLLPAVRPVINWRALGLTMFILLLMSLMWEVTLALPYGWWNFQDAQMLGLRITAWSGLPIEEIFVWIAISWTTVIVYETVRMWKASGKSLLRALLGP